MKCKPLEAPSPLFTIQDFTGQLLVYSSMLISSILLPLTIYSVYCGLHYRVLSPLLLIPLIPPHLVTLQGLLDRDDVQGLRGHALQGRHPPVSERREKEKEGVSERREIGNERDNNRG